MSVLGYMCVWMCFGEVKDTLPKSSIQALDRRFDFPYPTPRSTSPKASEAKPRSLIPSFSSRTFDTCSP